MCVHARFSSHHIQPRVTDATCTPILRPVLRTHSADLCFCVYVCVCVCVCVSCPQASVREAKLADASPLRLFLHPLYYRPLMAGLSLVLLQQVSGEPAVTYFATSVFRDAGVPAAQGRTRRYTHKHAHKHANTHTHTHRHGYKGLGARRSAGASGMQRA